jgi:hypothetical protein
MAIKAKTVIAISILLFLISKTNRNPIIPIIPIYDILEKNTANITSNTLFLSIGYLDRVILRDMPVRSNVPEQAKTSCCTVNPNRGMSGNKHKKRKMISLFFNLLKEQFKKNLTDKVRIINPKNDAKAIVRPLNEINWRNLKYSSVQLLDVFPCSINWIDTSASLLIRPGNKARKYVRRKITSSW